MGFMSNPATGGEFTPYVKYNAKAGRWYTKEDKPDAQEYEVKNFVAVFDFQNLRTGWFLFAAGVAPVRNMDPSLTQAAPNPGEGFKRGFEIRVFSEKNLGGVRELSSTAGAVIEAMNDLYDEVVGASEYAQGKLPVVKCTDTIPVTNKHGTNFKPVFQIASWVDRPVALAGDPPAAPRAASPPVAQATPASAKAEHVPPPAAKPAPVPAMADDDVEF